MMVCVWIAAFLSQKQPPLCKPFLVACKDAYLFLLQGFTCVPILYVFFKQRAGDEDVVMW